jgi:hypothetical protein
MKCTHCNKDTSNPKFCSRSCANTHANLANPKRKLAIRECINCGCIVNRKTYTDYNHFCGACRRERDYKLCTIGKYRNKASVAGKHPSWLHVHVRSFNRSWNKTLLTKPCMICGYNKHVELHHIRPISDFPDDTLLGEVNHPDNVVQLCPNCHWEVESGLLNLKLNYNGESHIDI